MFTFATIIRFCSKFFKMKMSMFNTFFLMIISYIESASGPMIRDHLLVIASTAWIWPYLKIHMLDVKVNVYCLHKSLLNKLLSPLA